MPSHVAMATVDFQIIGQIARIERIATGRGVEARNRLNKLYGKGRWRKVKGFASVRLPDGTIHKAEIHWYEAHGIGRRELKLKLPLLD
jgi:hypothetical protein